MVVDAQRLAEARAAVAAMSRLVYDRGLTAAAGGNISVRASDLVVITPAGWSLRALNPSLIAVIDLEGRHLEGPPPSSERLLHLAVYHRRPGVTAILHWYSGPLGTLERALAGGLYFSVNPAMLRGVFLSTARSTAVVMLILTGAFVLNSTFALLGIPHAISQAVAAMKLTPLATIGVLVALYLVLGTFMDGFAMMVTTIPVILPVLKAQNIDLVPTASGAEIIRRRGRFTNDARQFFIKFSYLLRF